MQTPQRQPCADLSGMPNPNESFVNVIPPQIRKIYVVDQILVDIINKYSSLLVYCCKNPCYLLCSPHDMEYLVTLCSQTIVQYIEGSGYVRVGQYGD